MARKIENGGVSEWGTGGAAASSGGTRVQFKNISHRYDNIQTLNNVSFEISPGEIVCLLGPSGCGKSTLLRIAAGVERQLSGQIFMDEREIAGPNVFLPPEERQIGLVFQDFALFPHKSILENVAFGLKKLTKSQAREEARAALDRVGMLNYENTYPYALSGGEQQRVALARAIAPRPSVLLMDEPFSGLDQRLRDSVRDETLSVLRESGACSLLVTHDPEEAMRMADRIILMRDGDLIQVGTPQELYNNPVDAQAARFFSDFNEVPGIVEGAFVLSPLGKIKVPGLETGARMNVLVRPRGIALSKNGKGQAGIVENVRFLGNYSLLDIDVDDCDKPIQALVAGEVAQKPGNDVKITIDPDQVFVFPGDGV